MTSDSPEPFLENIIFDMLAVGRSGSLSRTLTQGDIDMCAAVSGDVNPEHMDPAYAKTDLFHGVIGHGFWSSGMISAVLGTVLPGPGTVYLEQDLTFKKPVRIGDRITATVIVKEKKTGGKPIVTFDCRCTNGLGETVAEGLATVLAPTEKVRLPRPDMPGVEIRQHDRLHPLLAAVGSAPLLRTAVVHPVGVDILQAVADAAREKLIAPVLIGPAAHIKAAAKEGGIDISAWELVDAPHSHAAAAQAASMAGQGKVSAIMKGNLHTAELLGAIVAPESGLRTERRMSHCYLMDVAAYPKPFIITDAAVNIAPDLDVKADICRNAIDLWHILYGDDKTPKVAILAAVETVTPKMIATLDAAALCKMADRGQITGAILDGPLAFDNAISAAAAKEKGIVSPVSGEADILLVPEIEAGNMLAKQLIFLGRATAAAIVMGARVPIILPSRADNLQTRLLSCALAVHVAAAREKGIIK